MIFNAINIVSTFTGLGVLIYLGCLFFFNGRLLCHCRLSKDDASTIGQCTLTLMVILYAAAMSGREWIASIGRIFMPWRYQDAISYFILFTRVPMHVFGGVVAFVIHRHFKRLRARESATRVAAGQLDEPPCGV